MTYKSALHSHMILILNGYCDITSKNSLKAHKRKQSRPSSKVKLLVFQQDIAEEFGVQWVIAIWRATERQLSSQVRLFILSLLCLHFEKSTNVQL